MAIEEFSVHREEQSAYRRTDSDIADLYVGVHRERRRDRGNDEVGNVTAGVGVNANANANANVNANGVDVVQHKPRSTFANGPADRHVLVRN